MGPRARSVSISNGLGGHCPPARGPLKELDFFVAYIVGKVEYSFYLHYLKSELFQDERHLSNGFSFKLTFQT